MRSKLVPGVVIFFGLVFAQTLFGKKETVSSTLSVRQQFESEISNLRKNLNLKASKSEQWKHLLKTEGKIADLRKKNPRQIEQDEIYMDLVADSLTQIPRAPQFKKEKCGDYRSKLIAQYDLQYTGESDSPVAPALSVLEALCK